MKLSIDSAQQILDYLIGKDRLDKRLNAAIVQNNAFGTPHTIHISIDCELRHPSDIERELKSLHFVSSMYEEIERLKVQNDKLVKALFDKDLKEILGEDK
jgi:hypothetical protein